MTYKIKRNDNINKMQFYDLSYLYTFEFWLGLIILIMNSNPEATR